MDRPDEIFQPDIFEPDMNPQRPQQTQQQYPSRQSFVQPDATITPYGYSKLMDYEYLNEFLLPY